LQDAGDCSEIKADEDDENDDDDDGGGGGGGGCFIIDHVTGCRSAMMTFYSRHKSHLKTGLLAILTALYFAYFGYAFYYHFGDEGSVRLVWLTCLVVVVLALTRITRCLRPKCESMSSSKPIIFIRQHHKRINWFVALSHELM